MRGTLRAGSALLLGVAACAPAPAPGGPSPDPTVILSRLADPSFVYHDLGFFAKGDPLPFVASIRYLAGPSPDSTLAVFGLSLANRALSFRRTGGTLEGNYRVELVLRRGPEIVAQIGADQTVRVGTMGETRRTDESIIFQRFVLLPPGPLSATVMVRDRNRLTTNRDEERIEVPRLGASPGLSSLIPIYRGTGRVTRGQVPTILVNPRATSPQGADTLEFYVEAYGVDPGTPVYLTARRPDSGAVWQDTVQLQGADVAVAVGPDTLRLASHDLTSAMIRVSPPELQLGELRFEAVALGAPADTARAVALVTFSEQWAVTNLDDVLSLLRYFGHDEEVAQIRAGDADRRSSLWRAFWRRTDPDTTTPENEALSAYFRRLEIANVRFREESEAGWLTDRGEVYITLGEPDQIERSDDIRSNRTIIRWTYLFAGETILLYFANDLSLQRYRLTFSSRLEYERLLQRVRARSERDVP